MYQLDILQHYKEFYALFRRVYPKILYFKIIQTIYEFFIYFRILLYFVGTALLEYSIENKDTMDMYHTETPPAYRGQGLAKHVVKVRILFVYLFNADLRK